MQSLTNQSAEVSPFRTWKETNQHNKTAINIISHFLQLYNIYLTIFI